MVNQIPEGTHTVTPHLVVRGGARAIEFYKQAFGAIEVARLPAPDGMIMHAELRIGDSPVYLAEENPAWGSLSPLSLGGTGVTIHLFVPDVDSVFARALQAGATSRMPVDDMFWGDRYGQLADPFGHVWSIATHKEDLSPEEMARRAEEAFANMPPPPEPPPAPDPEPEPKRDAVARRPGGSGGPRKKKPAAKKKKPARKKKVAKKKAGKKKAAKKKPARKKVARKKKAARRKPARRKVARKKTARRKGARKTARKKTAKKKPARRKKATRKKAARKPARRKSGRRR